MTLRVTTEYALRALAFMALTPRDPLSAATLHRRLRIPRKYLQGLLTDLSKRGLIRSIRGRHGGYLLARPLRRISLAQIIDAAEGFNPYPRCFFGFPTCPVDNHCAMHDAWEKHRRSIVRTLTSTTLADIVPRKGH